MNSPKFACRYRATFLLKGCFTKRVFEMGVLLGHDMSEGGTPTCVGIEGEHCQISGQLCRMAGKHQGRGLLIFSPAVTNAQDGRELCQISSLPAVTDAQDGVSVLIPLSHAIHIALYRLRGLVV